MSIRNRIAHAFTPWEWRSRRSVVLLVARAVALMVAGAALALFGGGRPANRVVSLVVGEALLYFMVLRPALRSLQRWDEMHS